MTSEAVQISQADIEALKNRNVAILAVNMPPGLRDLIGDAADAAGMSPASFARQKLADIMGFTLPTQSQGRAKKYATEEERIEANKARAKTRRDQTNELLRQLKSGEISL